jgi:iron complex transport system permease protein
VTTIETGTALTPGIPSAVRHERRMLRRRIVVVSIVLAAVSLGLFVVSLMLGSVLLSPADVIAGIAGTAKKSTVFVVQELRLPRGTAALVVGLALGISGTLFQRVLGNPLAAPDFLGISAGAGTAASAALILGGVAGMSLSAFALLGGAATAALVYALAWRRGVSEYRFILVGIGVGAFASSVTSYLVARAEFSDARAAMTWLTGSVGLASPDMTALVAVAVVLFALFGLRAARMLRVLELGDESARMLGSRVELDRFLLLGSAVVLVSIATAAVGPIAFVAMLAGPLAQILLGPSGRSILAAALAGAVILQVADILAQHALPWPISTGVVTGVFGAPYIAFMLVSAARKARAR